VEFKKIPLENIKRRYLPVQKELVEEFPDDLISSIKTLGLIQPIAVYKNSEEEYDVIDGNRRLRAYRELNRLYPGDETLKEIECVIHTKNDDESKKIIHTSMHLGTTPLSVRDSIDSLRYFWNMYGDSKIIEMKYGIPENVLKRYVKGTMFSDRLKEAVSNGRVASDHHKALDVIQTAVDLLNWTSDNEVSDDKVIEVAILLTKKPLRIESF
jgi:ParB/RepB/Spo0J family partition protein